MYSALIQKLFLYLILIYFNFIFQFFIPLSQARAYHLDLKLVWETSVIQSLNSDSPLYRFVDCSKRRKHQKVNYEKFVLSFKPFGIISY